MGISSDAGSIPAWSTKKGERKLSFFCASGSRTRREQAKLAEANGPVDHLRRRGLKGGHAAGGIPAWSTKKRTLCKAQGSFFNQAGIEQGGSKRRKIIIPLLIRTRITAREYMIIHSLFPGSNREEDQINLLTQKTPQKRTDRLLRSFYLSRSYFTISRFSAVNSRSH